MNSSEISTVFRKEFIETARDWRTLCVGILIPLILYPVSLIVASKIMVARRVRNDTVATRVLVTGPGAAWFRDEFAKSPQVRLVDEDGTNPTELLKRGKVDVVVTVPTDVSGPYVPSSATPQITVRVDELRDSNGAYLRVGRLLMDARLRLSEKRISGFGIDSLG